MDLGEPNPLTCLVAGAVAAHPRGGSYRKLTWWLLAMVGSETSDISDAGSIPVISSVAAVNPDCHTLRQVFRAASRQISDMRDQRYLFALRSGATLSHFCSSFFAADAARGRGTDAQPFGCSRSEAEP